jgi:hypothetical protein
MSGLPWIKVWTALPNHPKVQRLERALGVEDALGIVIRLWCWTASYAPEGDIAAADSEAMVRAALGNVTRNATVTEALVTAGILDPIPGGWRVHDWHEAQTVHVEAEEKRRAQARERQARFRSKRSVTEGRDVTRDVTRDSVTEKEKEKETEKEKKDPPAPVVAVHADDPRKLALRAQWEAAFLADRGEPYRWQGAKDTKAIGSLVAVAPAEFRARAAKGLRASGYVRCSSVAQLASKWNDLAGVAPPPNGAAAKPRVIAGPGDFSDPEKAREGFLR